MRNKWLAMLMLGTTTLVLSGCVVVPADDYYRGNGRGYAGGYPYGYGGSYPGNYSGNGPGHARGGRWNGDDDDDCRDGHRRH